MNDDSYVPNLGETTIPVQRPVSDTLYQVAGFWVRTAAFLIDIIIIYCFDNIMVNSTLSFIPVSQFIYKVININAFFLGLSGAVYFILMTHYFQQTVGKMIVGIKVIQASGRQLSWSTTIFRELIGRSISQLLGLNLGYILCWFNANKRCLHDFISDTWVVYERSGYRQGYIKVGE